MDKREWKTLMRQRIYSKTCYCYLCGKPIKLNELSLDHSVPISRGGLNEPSNWKATHKVCNSTKGALTYEEWKLWQTLELKRKGIKEK